MFDIAYHDANADDDFSGGGVVKSYKELAIAAITSYLEIIFLTHSLSILDISISQPESGAVEREMKMFRNLGQVRLLLRDLMMMMMGIFLDLNTL